MPRRRVQPDGISTDQPFFVSAQPPVCEDQLPLLLSHLVSEMNPVKHTFAVVKARILCSLSNLLLC